jgi:hypothetical protein
MRLASFTGLWPSGLLASSRPSSRTKTPETRPATPESLSEWIEAHTGHRIPGKAVCDNHNAPLDFVWRFFNHELTEAIVLANRAGGKTFDTAALHLANGYWKPGFETSHIGAIQIQAKRAYAYYTAGLRHPDLREQAPDPHIGETVWLNGSRIEILPGTEAQTQGGHPHLASYDELEQGKRQPYENSKSMPVEWTNATGERHGGQFLATSTRQSGLGLMQRALDEAAETGTPVIEWCVFETMEPCDGKEGRPDCEAEACPLWQWCEGRAVDADGWRSKAEIVRLYNRVGRDTWEAQHLCLKPDAKSLIYAPFGPENITDSADYVPGEGQVWLFYDWGFTDPTHIAMVQQRGDAFYQFDELAGSNRSERDWVLAAVRRVLELPDYDGPDMAAWGQHWQTNDWPEEWPAVWPEAIGDPSAVQLRSEFKAHGINAARPQIVKHEVEAGQDVLRAAILSGRDMRRYFVHPRCKQTVRCLSNYRARELADGSFDPRPDPDPANHAFSHGCDALRYGFWRLRRILGISNPEGDGDV